MAKSKKSLADVFGKVAARDNSANDDRDGQGGMDGMSAKKNPTAPSKDKPTKDKSDVALDASEEFLKAQRSRTATQEQQLDILRRRPHDLTRRR